MSNQCLHNRENINIHQKTANVKLIQYSLMSTLLGTPVLLLFRATISSAHHMAATQSNEA